MGHKVHPYGYRLGYTRTWTAKWYADKDYTALLKEDIAIRQLLDRRLANASVSGVDWWKIPCSRARYACSP